MLRPKSQLKQHSCVAMALVVAIAPLAALAAPGTGSGAEAFEIGAGEVDELPRGKEADGIIGDFVLRNPHVEALVAGNLPDRKANMTTRSSAGCLYDLAVRGSDNDQLTNFAPGNFRGPVSSVRIPDAGSGGAAVRVERTVARGDGLSAEIEYQLESDWRHLVVVTTYENRREEPVKLDPAPAVKGLRDLNHFFGIHSYDAMDPFDRQGYAWATLDAEDAADAGEVEIESGGLRSFTYAVAPGRSPAEAFGVLARLRGPTGTLRGRLVDAAGDPVRSASAEILLGTRTETRKKKVKEGDEEVEKEVEETVEVRVPAYAREDGTFDVALPPGTYAVAVRDIGRPTVEREVSITEGETTELDVELDAAARLRFAISGAGGRPSPCKVQLLGVGGTEDPVFGVAIRAHGCDHQYHSENGRFTLDVPPGMYRVIVTRGIEFDHYATTVHVPPGAEVAVEATLERVVDTRGWVSTDYHNHSTPSGDNYCGTDDRVINLAAEHIEFAPTTEHNRLYDWKPHIDKLGLAAELSTIVGIELTGPNAHFNAFPLTLEPHTQDNGAPTWVHDPRINAIVLRDYQDGGADRWVHLNHPNLGEFLRDRDEDGRADGGYAGLERLIDAAEVWSTEILTPTSFYEVTNDDGTVSKRKNRTFEWLQFLNQGRAFWCISVSDAHSVFGNGVGGWRTYVKSSTDDPAAIDYREIIRNSKAGRMFMTNGPYLEVTTEDNVELGGLARAVGPYTLHVRVQTTSWVAVDRVQVLVNGRARPDVNFTVESHPDSFEAKGAVRFEATIPVELAEDAHLIVAAVGEKHDLSTGYGRSWQSGMHPCAFTNPIYVDVDGNGFEPNRDTLGYALPAAQVYGEKPPAQVRKEEEEKKKREEEAAAAAEAAAEGK